MTTVSTKLLVSQSLIDWLEMIFRERISPSLSLQFCPKTQQWRLNCTSSFNVITFSFIPIFYHFPYTSSLSCGSWNAFEEGFDALEPSLPVPGVDSVVHPLLIQTDLGFHFNYDIPGFIYWMLARCEELSPTSDIVDNHYRFPSTASHAFRHGYLDRPVIDEWIGVLRQVILRLWPSLPIVQKKFQLIVSHDVDSPSAYSFVRKRRLARTIVRDFLKGRDLLHTISIPWIRLKSQNYLHPCDPFNTFDWLMDISEAAGITSSFYFICGRTNPIYDSIYEPEHPVIRNLLSRIHHRGHEIGLHPSYNTFLNPDSIALEGSRLKAICHQEGIYQSQWGGRMHFLRWHWPTTAYGWVKAGFHYDSTLGYADRPGFRCGTCHPYQMFDPLTQRPLPLIQRPLIAMECSVIASRYLGYGYGSSTIELFQLLKQRCEAVAGQFTLLWHNSHLTNSQDRYIYRRLLLG